MLLLTTAVAGLNSSFMQNPSVMALYLPVASRLSSRTGLPLSRFLLPLGGRDRDGRLADDGRYLAADPAQRLARLIQRQPALGRGDARTAAHVRADADRLGAARRGAAVLPLLRRQAAGAVRHRPRRYAGAHAELLRAGLRHRRRRVRTHRVGRQPAGGHVARRSRSLARRAAAARAEDRQRIAPGPAGRCAHLGRQRARRDGRASRWSPISRRTTSCA